MFFMRKWKPPHEGLRPVHRSELRRWVGQTPPGTLYDADGLVLLAAGRVLTECCYRLIVNQPLFISSQPEVEAAAKGPAGITGGRQNRRRETRVPRHQVAVVTCPIDGDEKSARRDPMAVVDVSDRGLGLVCEGVVLRPGTRVVAEVHVAAGHAAVRGIVRSCTPIAGKLHRVGLEIERN